MPAGAADVVVVGAGIVGAATAHALAGTGHRVTVLEQYRVGHDHGSSHGSSRIFRLSYPDERYVRLAQASLPGWRALEEECRRHLLETTGSVDLGTFAQLNAKALSACGAAFATVDAATARARWGLRLAEGETGLHQPDAGTLLADAALAAFVTGAREAGATVREETTVLRIETAPRSVAVQTTGGEIEARAVVVAAGAWAPGLLAPLEITLPVVPTRETVAHFRAPAGRPVPCVIDDATPVTGDPGVTRAGSLTYALSSPGRGVKVGLHHSGPVTEPGRSGEPDEGVTRWAGEWVAQRLPDATATPELVETCLYTNTADEGFVLERHGRVVVAHACSGHAFKFAPAVGRTVAALASDAV
jgi:sarcosine oxidase